MKITDLPEKYKMYTLVMSNKSEYEITGTQKENIMKSDTKWIELPNGEVINKFFCMEIRLNNDRTRDYVAEHHDELVALEQRALSP